MYGELEELFGQARAEMEREEVESVTIFKRPKLDRPADRVDWRTAMKGGTNVLGGSTKRRR
jgi:hypothetical protein